MKIEIEVDEYVNKINDAYKRGFEDGMKSVKNTTPWTYPDPIGNPITHPAITWDTNKYGEPPEMHLNDNDMYEKAPYWMNPNFKMPAWSWAYTGEYTGTPIKQTSVTTATNQES